MTRRLSPYQRIVKAAREGKGVRLSVDECFDLNLDDAIATRADFEDERDAAAALEALKARQVKGT